MTTTRIEAPARSVPVVREVDVLVCGGGPAGVAAAIAAGRAGASVHVIESAGCLGGIWTSGLLCWVIDANNKTGLMAEIHQRMSAKPRANEPGGAKSAYDVEQTKYALEQMCQEAGVGVRLHTRVVEVVRSGERIDAVLTASKSGVEAWRAAVYIDCTGDGDLAAAAGCGFDYGRPDAPGEAQPMSMIALVGGLDVAAIGHDYLCGQAGRYAEVTDNFRNDICAGGVDPSYARPSLFHVYDDLFLMMANHQYQACGFSADDVSQATLAGRDEVNRIVDALRSRGGVWNDICLVATSAQIGIREGRRIHGRYMLSADDLVRGARFDDAVCRATFCVDVHSTNPSKGKGLGGEGVKAQPYDVPMRSLIACDVDNLLMAGRCISGDFFAHASYRVTGNAVAMGEGAGQLAAYAARAGLDPHQCSWPLEDAAVAAQRAL
ncbi:MAG: FAD-dependent oxidoreductase [Planctomycetota bacterium]|jgi:hypothetical protein|nr:FAD-dependent oxidoreductase [Planctomycetota bacterium]